MPLRALCHCLCVCLVAGLADLQCADLNLPRDLYQDTWVATDALGRRLPEFEEAGAFKPDKKVGIFYFLWLGQHGTRGPYDITELLKDNPNDPKWGPKGAFHHWGKPELGYYTSDSEYVMKKHLFMLNDAGIDVLIFDVTNSFTYDKVFLKLCKVYTAMREQGHATPQLCFLTHSHSQRTITHLYKEFYAPRKYPGLWYYWKGKPLILGDAKGLSPEVRDFFSIRFCWAWTHGKDRWQWLDHAKMRYGWHESADRPEEVSVSVAQHPTTNIGRSHQAGKQPVHNMRALTGLEDRGRYFAEQWKRALAINPEFIFITGWNEWVAQRFINNGKQGFLGKSRSVGTSFFVDAYSQEYSRDIEPMAGGYSDNYYYQMIANIRRFKGMRQRLAADRDHAIAIDGQFDDWAYVQPEFRDTAGDTLPRDERGWGKAGRYVNKTGRNDFITLKVACHEETIAFYAETREPITAPSGDHWMLLLVDVDRNAQTGLHGYELLINHKVTGDNVTSVKRLAAGGAWKTLATVPYRRAGRRMELAVPRGLIQPEKGKALAFDFHWADNVQSLDDMAAFALYGDSAPNRRFNYRFERKKKN